MLICTYCLQELLSRGELVNRKHFDPYDDERVNERFECRCQWCDDDTDASEIIEIEFK